MNKKHVGLAHPGSCKRKYIYLIGRVTLYFDEPVGGVKTRDTSKKYPMILHTKPFNNRFIIQLEGH